MSCRFVYKMKRAEQLTKKRTEPSAQPERHTQTDEARSSQEKEAGGQITNTRAHAQNPFLFPDPLLLFLLLLLLLWLLCLHASY